MASKSDSWPSVLNVRPVSSGGDMRIDFHLVVATARSMRRKIVLAARVSRSCGALVVVPFLCSACSNDTGPTAKFATFEHASIQGTVLSDKGAPLDSVAISFKVPSDRGSYRGGTASPLTGADGAFRLDLERLSDPIVFTRPSLDTMTIRLVGSYLGVHDNETLPHDTVFVRVHFVPKGQEAEPSTAELHIAMP